MEPVFQIAICGGGNLCHGSIAVIGHNNPKYKINVLSRRPEVWDKQILAHTQKSIWESKGDMVGKINKCSSDAKDVIPGSQIILICSPAQTKVDILKQIKPYLQHGAYVGSIFGQGGFDLQAQYALGDDIKNKDLTIFCLQYVPFLCKVVNYGKDVNIIGPKKHLYVTSYPVERVHEVCTLMSLAYFIPSVPLPNFLSLTLCPSNQIIHPGRVYGFFKDWDGKTPYSAKAMPLLYEGLDQVSADEIQYLDDEIQLIKQALLKKYPNLNLDQVMPIKTRIESMYDGQISDTSSLKRVFNTNIGYSRVPFPMIPADKTDSDKVTLNLNARFFWEDVPFGLVILKDIGELVGVQTPHIDKQIIFHQKFMPVKYICNETGKFLQDSPALKESGAPRAYGIRTAEALVAMSLAKDKSSYPIFRAKL